MKTNGYFLIQKGKASTAFQLQPIDLPALKENELLIEVEAFGLNYADVMARKGLYREAPPLPCVLGYEVVGKVVQTGSSIDASWLEKRVVGFTRFGGYAQHVITTIEAIVEIKDMTTEHALALATQGVTAYYMANYVAPIHENETVLIHAAAGGVGSLLIQLAKQAGAKVIAKIGSDEKQQLCFDLGADYVVNYRKNDYQLQIEQTLGVKQIDAIFNPVGGSTFKKDKSLLNAGGRIVLFGGSELANGNASFFRQLSFLKKMGVIIPVFQMMQSKSVIGVNMLKIADAKPTVLKTCLSNIINTYQQGNLKVVSGGIFSHEDLAKAHDLLESGKSTGKISIHW
jgi:NADPH:quinone reductase-like Zn-dependent oxidoreductase